MRLCTWTSSQEQELNCQKRCEETVFFVAFLANIFRPRRFEDTSKLLSANMIWTSESSERFFPPFSIRTKLWAKEAEEQNIISKLFSVQDAVSVGSRFLVCYFSTLNIKGNIYKTNYDAYYQEWPVFSVNSLLVGNCSRESQGLGQGQREVLKTVLQALTLETGSFLLPRACGIWSLKFVLQLNYTEVWQRPPCSQTGSAAFGYRMGSLKPMLPFPQLQPYDSLSLKYPQGLPLAPHLMSIILYMPVGVYTFMCDLLKSPLL